MFLAGALLVPMDLFQVTHSRGRKRQVKTLEYISNPMALGINPGERRISNAI